MTKDLNENTENSVIRFRASVAQVKTMADGGLRLSLDLSEKDINAATQMMMAKQAGAILEIALVVIDPQKKWSDFNLDVENITP